MAHLSSSVLIILLTALLCFNSSVSQDGDSGPTQKRKLNPKDPEHRQSFQNQVPEENAAQSEKQIEDLHPKVTTTAKPPGFRLADLPECHDDVAQFCPKDVNRNNNFQVLTCLQDNAKEDDLSDECHMTLWHYKYNLTHGNKFERPAEDICQEALLQFQECEKEHVKIPCLLEHRLEVTNAQCRHFLTKLQSIYFSDHRLIGRFIDKCGTDIVKQGCGRISSNNVTIDELHSQGEVIDCLEDKIQDIADECRNEIFHLAELQSDDYHLDRPLYYACRDDREKFCADIQSGEGKVYKCLVKNKFDERMSNECRDKLTLRQKIIAKDYKAQYPLMKSCKADSKKYKCKTSNTSYESLAHLLLCLQEQISLGNPVEPDCQNEVHEASQELMEDYSLNPNVVAQCAKEIKNYCKGGLKKEGETLDCLMKIGEDPHGGESLSKECESAITELLKETGAAGDYTIDRTLAVACEPVVHHLCKDTLANKEGDLMIVSCLMENLYSNDMEEACRNQLLHLQFFVSRDFRLHPGIYKVCNDDAKKVCHAPDWNEEKSELPVGMVMSCLFRNSLPDAEEQISTPCKDFVLRTMHQRAVDVHLIPEIQQDCLIDLGKHCTEKVEKGEEIECLQENFDSLDAKCKETIAKFTEEEGEDYKLDKSLVKACGKMVTKFCQDIVAHGETNEVLPCLIANKNNMEMDFKCRASIEHWQLLEIKDFNFSPLFKEACKKDVRDKCSGKKKKADVIKCLSGKVHKAVMQEKDHEISKKCRKQLKVELLEQSEDIRLDPEMFGDCEDDVNKFCTGVHPGNAQIIECLKDHQEDLSQKCHIQIFNREKVEAEDRTLDYSLMRVCKRAIKNFCSGLDTPDDIFHCLKKWKNDEEMDPKCRNLIVKRQKLQSKDIRLNPEMQLNCKRDVEKFCSDIKLPEDEKLYEGKVISCLKKNKERLSEDCEYYVRNLEKEASLDYRLDPVLSKECESEIFTHCGQFDPGKGQVEKCLKSKVKQITNNKCLIQIARIVGESQNDIYVDAPLYQACHRDIEKHCEEVEKGEGRVMKCLLTVNKESKQKLSKECHNQLQLRANLWSLLHEKKIEIPAEVVNLPQLMTIVSTSPSRNYFYLIFFVALALIFLGGLVSGRISKRVRQEFKNR